MGLLFSSLYEFLRGGNPWGMARLPDGRGIVFPLITSVYLVPSDDIYHRIRRKMFVWEILFLPVGLCLGPAVIVVYRDDLNLRLVGKKNYQKPRTLHRTGSLDNKSHIILGNYKAEGCFIRHVFFFYCPAVIVVFFSIMALYILIGRGSGRSLY
jgi:hypothetical protein